MLDVPTHLTEEQIRDVLARAEEIHLKSADPEMGSAEIEAVVSAAEEAGLSREAILQALRERVALPMDPPQSGERVFAKSSDGKFYVADVVSVQSDLLRVRFVRGGETSVRLADIQPCTFLPGSKVVCPWPNWGWWTCTVVSYNADKQKVKVTDGWGSHETFPISEVRLDPPKPQRPGGPMPRMKFFLVSLGAGLATGGVLGGLITWLMMR